MIDWRRWCRAADLTVRDAVIEVALPDGRRHRVSIIEDGSGELRLVGRIATRTALARLDHPELAIWERNRASSVVGFRFDRHNTLVGEIVVPRAGLDAAEFGFYVRTLAAECDRMEVLLTGNDVE